MPDTEQLVWVALLVGAALLPVLFQAWRSRRRRPPFCARKDRRAYRLWQSDPGAYERKYGEFDRRLEPPRPDQEEDPDDPRR